MTATTPSAPPLRGTAPLTSASPSRPAPAPVLDPTAVAAAIAASADPAAVLTHVVLAVAGRAANAPEQGVLLSKVQAGCADMLKRVRAALLASIGENPGTYEGFEVAQRGGSRSVDYARLEEEYPEIYDEVVKIGAPTLVVKYGPE